MVIEKIVEELDVELNTCEEIKINKYDLAKILNCVSDDCLVDTGCVDLFNQLENSVKSEIEELFGEQEWN